MSMKIEDDYEILQLPKEMHPVLRFLDQVWLKDSRRNARGQ